jgi:hypothetical protein
MESEGCEVTLGDTRGIPHLSGPPSPRPAVTSVVERYPAETTICREEEDVS